MRTPFLAAKSIEAGTDMDCMVLLPAFSRTYCPFLCGILLVTLLALGSPSAWAERRFDDADPHRAGTYTAIEWQTDYRQAREQAIEAHKNLLIHF